MSSAAARDWVNRMVYYGDVITGDINDKILLCEIDDVDEWMEAMNMADIKNKDGKVKLKIEKKYKEGGMDVNVRNKSGQTALQYAVERYNIDLVRFLIRLGANVRVLDSSGNTLLFKVLEFKDDCKYARSTVRHERRGRLLVVKRDTLNEYKGCLDRTVWECGIDMIEMLVRAGVDINAKDRFGETLLHKGMQSMHNSIPNLVWWLVGLKSDVKIKDEKGNTALHYAVRYGCHNVPMVKMMLNNGGDPNVANNEGKTPLYYAAEYGDRYRDIMKLMIDKVKNPNIEFEEEVIEMRYHNKAIDGPGELIDIRFGKWNIVDE